MKFEPIIILSLVVVLSMQYVVADKEFVNENSYSQSHRRAGGKRKGMLGKRKGTKISFLPHEIPPTCCVACDCVKLSGRGKGNMPGEFCECDCTRCYDSMMGKKGKRQKIIKYDPPPPTFSPTLSPTKDICPVQNEEDLESNFIVDLSATDADVITDNEINTMSAIILDDYNELAALGCQEGDRSISNVEFIPELSNGIEPELENNRNLNEKSHNIRYRRLSRKLQLTFRVKGRCRRCVGNRFLCDVASDATCIDREIRRGRERKLTPDENSAVAGHNGGRKLQDLSCCEPVSDDFYASIMNLTVADLRAEGEIRALETVDGVTETPPTKPIGEECAADSECDSQYCFNGEVCACNLSTNAGCFDEEVCETATGREFAGDPPRCAVALGMVCMENFSCLSEGCGLDNICRCNIATNSGCSANQLEICRNPILRPGAPQECARPVGYACESDGGCITENCEDGVCQCNWKLLPTPGCEPPKRPTYGKRGR